MGKKVLKYKTKEISEKSFELNITNELLNLSKSFIWYLDHAGFHQLKPLNILQVFLKQSVIFAEGLTQGQEAKEGGGYDVSINFKSSSGDPTRLMFLQYKAGRRRNYCSHISSNFHLRSTGKNEHVLFTFNDAANKKQHGILRNLASIPEIRAKSVLYVFPRITEKTDFEKKVGKLVNFTSFVPIVDLDAQANSQNPPITINDGRVHKYRTSYDGNTSEVNFFFFFYSYNQNIIFELLAELICVQIERLAYAILREKDVLNEGFRSWVKKAIDEAIENFNFSFGKMIIDKMVDKYLEEYNQNIRINSIPTAPQKFSSILHPDGLYFKIDVETTKNINYQIF